MQNDKKKIEELVDENDQLREMIGRQDGLERRLRDMCKAKTTMMAELEQGLEEKTNECRELHEKLLAIPPAVEIHPEVQQLRDELFREQGSVDTLRAQIEVKDQILRNGEQIMEEKDNEIDELTRTLEQREIRNRQLLRELDELRDEPNFSLRSLRIWQGRNSDVFHTVPGCVHSYSHQGVRPCKLCTSLWEGSMSESTRSEAHQSHMQVTQRKS